MTVCMLLYSPAEAVSLAAKHGSKFISVYMLIWNPRVTGYPVSPTASRSCLYQLLPVCFFILPVDLGFSRPHLFMLYSCLKDPHQDVLSYTHGP